MLKNEFPIPQNEMERVINLAELNLDFSNFENSFKELATLAAKITGTPISLINLIDSYTQWTVSNHGLPIDQMPREDSVCQYTIMKDDHFEIKDLAEDDRFKNKFYVKDQPKLRYYFGVPLTTEEGHNIGALCVLDTNANGGEKIIDAEKLELLKIIANEIVQRLKTLHTIKSLQEQLFKADDIKKKVVHDIRGPIGGIIGLSKIISDQGDHNNLDEVLEFIDMIHRSSSSLLELTDEILSSESKEKHVHGDEFNLQMFKEKLEKLYFPQAKNKNIDFTVQVSSANEKATILKDKLLQITGNLISNAIKFTPQNGTVSVDLNLIKNSTQNTLNIIVKDSGIGISSEVIAIILDGNATSTKGTTGEQGYGFGLALVKHLVDKLNGEINITSVEGEGTIFEIKIPQGLENNKQVLQEQI